MRQVTRKGLMTMAAASGVLAAAGGAAHADAGAQGSATHSPGVLSGNTVQAPVESEVNVCGNTVSVVGLLNPAAGNKCSNGGGGKHARGGQGGGQGASYGGSHAGGHAGDSPGVASGNHVQVPMHAPVNVCGNSVDVVGVANPASGNDCSNGGAAAVTATTATAATVRRTTAPTRTATPADRRAWAPATASRSRSTYRSTCAATASP
nr:chaplin [Streptomyces sp. LBUM 1477]